MKRVQMFDDKPNIIGQFVQIDEAVDPFKKGCHVLGLSDGRYSLVDLIANILHKTGKADIVLAVWSSGLEDCGKANLLLKEGLVSSWKIIIDRSYKTRKPKHAKTFEENFGIENIRTANIHAKFCLISNEDYQVAIRTSMNFNRNRRIEMFEYNEGPEIFDFLNDLVTDLYDNSPSGLISESSMTTRFLNSRFGESKFADREKHWTE